MTKKMNKYGMVLSQETILSNLDLTYSVHNTWILRGQKSFIEKKPYYL